MRVSAMSQIPSLEGLEPRLLMSASQNLEAFGQTELVDFAPETSIAVAGAIDEAGEADLYRFVAPADGWVVIEMDAVGADLDAQLELYNSKGKRVARNKNISRNDTDSRIRRKVKAGQTYYVKAIGSADSVGEYALTFTSDPKDDYAATVDEAKVVKTNKKGSGARKGWVNYDGDVDLLQVTATRSGLMQIELNGLGAKALTDCSVAVVDAAGQLLAVNNGFGSSFASLALEVVAGQTYYIRASAGGASDVGKYKLRVSCADLPPEPVPSPEPIPSPDVEVDPTPDPTPDADDDLEVAVDPSPMIVAAEEIVAQVQSLVDGLRLWIFGTDQNDVIRLDQTADQLALTTDAGCELFDGAFTDVRIFGFGGDDVLQTTAAVTAETFLDGGDGADQLYEAGGHAELSGGAGDDLLVSIGGGADILTGGAGFDSAWFDKTDALLDASAAETDAAAVHAVGEFYQPYTTNPAAESYVSMTIDGQDLIDPELTYWATGYSNYADAPLFVDGPQYDDITQGGLGDCYYLSVLAGYAQDDPNTIYQMMTPLGDGTYAVRFYRNGREVYLRVDSDLAVRGSSMAYADLTASGETWVAIAEKAYAYFRYGQNSYDSIEGGWMNTVYKEISNSQATLKWTTGMTAANLFNYIAGKVDSGCTVSLGSRSGGAGPIVGGHAYAVLAVDTLAQTVTVYNPWGVDGRSYNADSNDGVLELSLDQVKDAFLAVAVSVA